MDYLDPKTITYLPNTAGCYTSEDALRTLRLAREIGGWRLVKLEVLGDKNTLFPNMSETIKSTKILAKEGFDPDKISDQLYFASSEDANYINLDKNLFSKINNQEVRV